MKQFIYQEKKFPYYQNTQASSQKYKNLKPE